MTDQTSPMPPPLQAAKPKGRRWFKIFMGVCAAIFLIVNLIKIAGSQIDLELTRQGAFLADDGKAVEITNVGNKPVNITGIKINDRDDCKAGPLTLGAGGGNFPVTLKVGDKQMFISSCRIIRANVKTDSGSGTYSFASN
jgi:hypothetical protein